MQSPLDVEPVLVPEYTTNSSERGSDYGQRCRKRIQRSGLERPLETGFHEKQIAGPLFECELLEFNLIACRERFDPASREPIGILFELIGGVRSAGAQQRGYDAEENDEREDADQGLVPVLVRSGWVPKSLQKPETGIHRGSCKRVSDGAAGEVRSLRLRACVRVLHTCGTIPQMTSISSREAP